MKENNQSIYLQKLEYDEKLDTSWIAFFIDRARFVWLLLIIIFIAGMLGIKNLPLESMPEVDIGMIYVIHTLPGASPESVEDLVTKKIETQISKVKGIDTMSSTSMNSSSMILLQLKSGVDTKIALRDVKDKVDEARVNLPQDVLEPIIKEVAFDDFPVWTFAISGEYDGFELYDFAKKIQKELEKISLVGEVKITGGYEKEYGVFIDPKKIEEYGLALSNINSAIQSSNITLPIGDIEIGDYVHNLNVDSRFYSLESLKQIVITKLGDTGIIYLGDIADIQEIPKKITSGARLSIGGGESFDAVNISVSKKKGGSIVNLVSDGEKAIEKLFESGALPQDLFVQTIVDNAKMIKTDLSHLIRDGIITVLLVFFSLLLIIGAKEALVAGTAVPIVFFITFAVMLLAGQTLNFLSMFALILSLGLLVDDAIVIVSAMNQYKKSGKFTTRQAAILVVRDYKKVLTTTTLTVLFIFGAMLFMDGMIGSFIYSIPFVISVVLITSLIVALTLNPALAVILAGDDKKTLKREKKGGILSQAFEKGFISIHALETKYANKLEHLLSSKKRVSRFLFGVLILFFSAIALPITGILKSDFFPSGDADNFSVNIELESGTKLEKTSEVTKKIEEFLLKESEIESFGVSLGSGAGGRMGGGTSSEHLANISVKLLTKEDGRKEKSYDIVDRLRKDFSNIDYAKVTIVEEESGPGNSPDFEIKVAGENFDILDRIIFDAKKVLETIPGVIDIETSKKALPFEFDIILDRERVALYDITIPQVSSFLRNVIDGTQVTNIFLGEEEIKVKTRFLGEYRDDIEKIKDLKIQNNAGLLIPLRDIISTKFTPSVFSIERYDQKRIVSLSASAKKGYSGKQIQDIFDEKMKGYNLPTGYEFITGGVSEENAKSVASLGVSMIFGLMLIIGLLVILYDSYKQAFMVMLTIPLSLIGVFYGLTLFGQPLSFPGMIGLVALFGIVVRNGIILFDKINQNIAEDIPFKEAIVDAGLSRLEPVLLTSICTVLGMIPLTLSNPTWVGLGMSIMFGLSTSTLFTLFVLPSLYFIVFRKKHKSI